MSVQEMQILIRLSKYIPAILKESIETFSVKLSRNAIMHRNKIKKKFDADILFCMLFVIIARRFENGDYRQYHYRL